MHDAISKTISGVRIWNPEHCTLFQHLAGVVVSDIGHMARSAESRSTLAPPAELADGRWPPNTAAASSDQAQAMEWRSEQCRLLAHLEAADPGLARMAELMLIHDLQKTSVLSERLGVAAGEIANLRKRLKRAVRAHLAEHGP